MEPRTIDWPRIHDLCEQERWHAAYSALPLCLGKGDDLWAAGAAYIEERKAEALERLIKKQA